jgi:hypothetical protein
MEETTNQTLEHSYGWFRDTDTEDVFYLVFKRDIETGAYTVKPVFKAASPPIIDISLTGEKIIPPSANNTETTPTEQCTHISIHIDTPEYMILPLHSTNSLTNTEVEIIHDKSDSCCRERLRAFYARYNICIQLGACMATVVGWYMLLFW